MTEKEIQRVLAFARFNMACEGFEATEENMRVGREILEGKITADAAVARYIKQHGLTAHDK